MQDNDFDKLFAQKIKDVPRLDGEDASWDAISKKLAYSVRKLWWKHAALYAIPMIALVCSNIYFWQASQQNSVANTQLNANSQVVGTDAAAKNTAANNEQTAHITVESTPPNSDSYYAESRLSQPNTSDKKPLVSSDNAVENTAHSSKLVEQHQHLVNETHIADNVNNIESAQKNTQIDAALQSAQNNATENQSDKNANSSIAFLTQEINLLDIAKEDITTDVLKNLTIATPPIKVRNSPKMPQVVLSANLNAMPFLNKVAANGCSFGADVAVIRHIYVTATADFTKFAADAPNIKDEFAQHGHPADDGYQHPNAPDTGFVYHASRLPNFKQQTYGLGLKYVLPTHSKLSPFAGLSVNAVRTSAHNIEFRYHSKEGPGGGPHHMPRTELINQQVAASKPKVQYVSATAGLSYQFSEHVALNGAVSYRQRITDQRARTDLNALSLSTGLQYRF